MFFQPLLRSKGNQNGVQSAAVRAVTKLAIFVTAPAVSGAASRGATDMGRARADGREDDLRVAEEEVGNVAISKTGDSPPPAVNRAGGSNAARVKPASTH